VQAALAESSDTVIIAGSVRRWKETVGDIDIVIASAVPETTIETVTQLPLVEEVISRGRTKSSVILQGGIRSDVLVVPREMAGSALQYFTGSKEHNIALRAVALQKGYTLNEYGLFERNSKKKVAGESEKDIYHRLELQYIPPELRENRGEIEAAQQNALPNLVNLSQIKGDFHVHTEWSDGRDSVESILLKAQALHYCYIGICDHSQSSRIANGLSEEKLLDQNAFIKEVNDRVKGITVLSGIECDILPDGSLDYADSVLEQLDFVTASIHSRFTSSEKENTQRVVSAMENPLVNIVAHPTCRIIGKRDPLPLDFETLFQSAEDTKTALEINCYPDRLDLTDILIQRAVEAGVTLALGTDAHSIHDLDFMDLGVKTARRGWAEPKDILNTVPADNLSTIRYLR
jgi:DNA polymerase (family 10)